MHYMCGKKAIFLLTLLVCVLSGRIVIAEALPKVESVYNQATRNVVPINELQVFVRLGQSSPSKIL